MGPENRFPSIDHLRQKAKRRIPHFAWEYLDSGTGADRAMAANRQALEDVRFDQTILQGTIAAELGTRILGQDFARPIGIAPVGSSGMIWPGAEAALARLAADAGIPYTLSTVATRTPEEIGPITAGNGWFQLYALGNHAAQDDVLRRAADAGFRTLVLTVDVPMSSRRERQRRAGFTMPPRISAAMFAQMITSPAWLMGIARHGKPKFKTLAQYIPAKNLADVTRRMAKDLHPQPDWTILDRLRAAWNGPIVFKGILNPMDAKKARDLGVDAVWVSNHGGRQLDAAHPALKQLPLIRAAVGPEYPLIFDSGIRSGLDVARALALGADMVMAGRPFFYGLGAMGDAGAAHVLALLEDDLRNAMGQIGTNTIAGLKEACCR